MQVLWLLVGVLFMSTPAFSQCEYPGDNLVLNGSFELGYYGFASEYVYSSSRTRQGNFTVHYSAAFANPMNFHAEGDGNFMIVDGGKDWVVWEQAIAVLPDRNYEFSLQVATLDMLLGPPATLTLILNQNIETLKAPMDIDRWQTYRFAWFSGKQTELFVQIECGKAQFQGHDFALDNVTLTECLPGGLQKGTAELVEHPPHTPPRIKKKALKEREPEPFIKRNPPGTMETFEKLEVGTTVILENIFFDQSRADLREASLTELNKLANTLKKYPELRIAIIGHTDNVGHALLNWRLSVKRAQAVMNFLIGEGISRTRLKYKGMGDRMPLADNDTETGRKQNRRVEFKVEARN
ncbi:OmpA family protein [Rapidithrix thailandica]|uniref:OmpA family protein n=1 Tax=Rapidithrix thailandica TaxID=413964 RepID=A0AAW9S1P6_9BACT